MTSMQISPKHVCSNTLILLKIFKGLKKEHLQTHSMEPHDSDTKPRETHKKTTDLYPSSTLMEKSLTKYYQTKFKSTIKQ